VAAENGAFGAATEEEVEGIPFVFHWYLFFPYAFCLILPFLFPYSLFFLPFPPSISFLLPPLFFWFSSFCFYKARGSPMLVTAGSIISVRHVP
jgi:hypothetical protein